MTWPEADLYDRLVRRTEPGPGALLPDSELPADGHLKMKSIPNADTDRLLRVRLYLHDQLHTTEGLRNHDDPRRQLANGGLRIKAISHELRLRGYGVENGCRFCGEGRDDLEDADRAPAPAR
jgi:hypothetical protein